MALAHTIDAVGVDNPVEPILRTLILVYVLGDMGLYPYKTVGKKVFHKSDRTPI